MRARALALSLLGSVAVLVIGWEAGSQHAPTSGSAAPVRSAPPETTTRPTTAAGPSTSSSAESQAASTPKAATGTFSGTVAQTVYGPVQVAIVVRAGRITDVKALQLTDQGGRSIEISANAAPQLRQEALTAQSAKIDTVSGATYTSDGYRSSLRAAIDAAHL